MEISINMTDSVRLAGDKTFYIDKNKKYLRNISVTEYDVKSAGFSVLKNEKVLGPKAIEALENLPNKQRHIVIGKLSRKHPEINKKILETLSYLRMLFVDRNNIEEDDILSIKKDAIFIIKKHPKILKFGNYIFAEKNTYTSYMYLENNIELCYSSYDDSIDIKGISDESRELQKDFLIKEIKKLLGMAERLQPEDILDELRNFQYKYLHRELPLEYYRDMRSGKYLVRRYECDEIEENMRDEVEIMNNYAFFIMPIINLIL